MADNTLLVASLLLLSPAISANAENFNVPAVSRDVVGSMKAVNRSMTGPQAIRAAGSWNQFNEAIAKNRPSIVMIAADAGAGAGFIISPKGSVLTSAELVEGAGLDGQVGIMTASGQRMVGRVLSINTALNVARVQIDSEKADWPAVSLGDGSSSRAGTAVAVLGCPFDALSAVSFASIEQRSGGFIFLKGSHQFEVSRRILAANRENDLAAFCRGDFALSGGAVIDSRGQVIGLAQAMNTRKGGWTPVQGMAVDSEQIAGFLAAQNLENDRSASTYACPEIDIHNIEKVRLSNGLHGGPVWVEHTEPVPPAAIADRYFSAPLAAEPSIEHMVKNGNDTPWWFSSTWRGDRHRDKIKDAGCFLRGVVAFYLWGNEDPKEQTPGSIRVPYEVRPGPDGAQERADPELARRLIELRWFEHDGPVNPANGKRMGRFHRWFNIKMGRELDWFSVGFDPNTRQEIIDETFRPIPAGHAINDLY